MKNSSYTLSFNQINLTDISLVGGKNASLGELTQNLSSEAIKIPKGFAITIFAFNEFMEFNNLKNYINKGIREIDYNDLESLRITGKVIRKTICMGKFPDSMILQLEKAYNQLSSNYSIKDCDVAVRSSATTEDLPNASFAGQQDTFLNIKGFDNMLEAVKKCFASLYTDRAISHRESMNFDQLNIAISVGIQKMVRSDLGTSGVAFSLDTESGFKDVVLINASYGLGELIVKGEISPDEFIVYKPKLKEGYDAIIEKKLGSKEFKMIYDKDLISSVKNTPVWDKYKNVYCLT
ncbi:MAG: phosphoenolpyruvate synthase, partial [Flavobacteriales bacterium]|nr:phosphoenolpyruvate synthase [Flavobacteriales bacterium]